MTVENGKGNQGKPVRFQPFHVSIALLVVGIVFVLLLIFFTFIRSFVLSSYEQDTNKKIMDTARFIVAQVDGDQIETLAHTMERNDYYFSMLTLLYELKDAFDIAGLYIMVDKGDPGTYTYVFDALVDDRTKLFDDSNFANTRERSQFPGGDQVLRTGLAFDRAQLYRDEGAGSRYYVYLPVFNSRGTAVAFMGVDVDANNMFETIRRMEMNLVTFGLILFAVVFAFIVWFGRRYLTGPLLKMSDDIIGFSKGNRNIAFSPKLLRRRDEFGIIYRAFHEASQTITELVDGMGGVTSRVAAGHLDAAIENNYKGSYAQLVDKANKMLRNNRRVLDRIPNTVIFYDSRFRELYRNQPASAIYRPDEDGADRKMAVSGGATVQSVGALEALQQKMLDSGESSYAGALTLTDGEIPTHYNVFLTRTGEGDTAGYCAVFTDVTEYVEMSERAEASNKAKSEFLSRMSHEIRTPMNAIIGMTEIAMRQNPDEEVARQLKVIENSASHLLAIINDILDISKIEYGNLELFYGAFDLRAMINGVVDILTDQAKVNSVELVASWEGFDEGPVWVVCDEVRLRQVIINLASNAVKFSRSGETVCIGLEKLEALQDNCTRIGFRVVDQGIGIEPDKVDRIFEAFEQGGANIARHYGGTGLGLPISNNIVGLMGGGHISVQSRMGEGSVFSFELELENPGGDQGEDCQDTDGTVDLEGVRILLVDDIEINREIVIALLEDSGAEIDCADDGSTALKQYLAEGPGHYDLVFMDIQMREMDGYTATRRIRAAGREDSETLKIIGMSANAYQSDIDAAMEAGMNDYITKPVDYGLMLKAMARVLAK